MQSADAGGRLSIGALSRATGVPVETLRTWESRYGFPEPERKPSGHRHYSPAIVPRLRRIAEALARGHRASDTVSASDAELAQLLDTTPAAPLGGAERPVPAAPDVGSLVDAVAAFDAERLTRQLLADWARLGVIDFLDQRVAPLVRALGDGWADGRLEIRHEHFGSERIGDLLRTLRLPFEDRASGPLVVFSTLPGEGHSLGLQMAALVVAAAGRRVLYLGAETPVEQLADLVVDLNARVLAVSVSLAARGTTTRRQLARLRASLPRRVTMLVGGEGAPAVRDVDTFADFRALDAWARSLGA